MVLVGDLVPAGTALVTPGLITLPCAPVLSWRAWVISTFDEDNWLGLSCSWWLHLPKLKCKASLARQCCFFFVTSRNHWHGTHVAFCNLCNGQRLYSSKSNIFLFVAESLFQEMHHLVKRRCFGVLTGQNNNKRGLSWTTKEAYHEPGGRSSMFSQRTPLRIAITKLGLRCVKLGFAKIGAGYLTNVGFALFSPKMSTVTCMTSAVLSRMNWRPANESIHPPLTQKLQNLYRFR